MISRNLLRATIVAAGSVNASIGARIAIDMLNERDGVVYGLLLILFIIYMPKGFLGPAVGAWKRYQR